MSGLIVIATGLCYKSVCVPADWDRERILLHAGIAGTTRGWQISENTHFKSGQPNPCDCEKEPGRRHYLLDC